MRCRKAQTWLSASVDGALDEARERAALAHAAECPRCRQFADALPRCAQSVDRLPLSEPLPGFTDRLMAQLPVAQPEPQWLAAWLDVLRPAPAAFAALGLAVGALMASSISGQQATATSETTDSTEAFYTECFDAVPIESAGATYLALLDETEI